MDLKIKDVAELLNVSEKTIRRWLSEEKIPAYRINNQFRFSRIEIEGWVISQCLETSGGTPFQKINTILSEEVTLSAKNGLRQFSLYRALHKGDVLHQVVGETKEQVIKNTMHAVAEKLDLDVEALTALLMDRENLQSTGIGNGIAIPHTRDYLLRNYQDIVVIAFPKTPLAYDAIDGKPVTILFFLFACEDKRHLHLLSKIAHLSHLPQMISILQTQPDKETLLEYVKEWESSIEKAQDVPSVSSTVI